ncbi:hypothetical protein KKA00_11565 [bacterium]|nr:hypothetical protein [bacterium]
MKMILEDESVAVAMSRPELMDLLRQSSQRLGRYIEACDWQNTECAIEERNDLLRALAATLNSENSAVLQPDNTAYAKGFLTEIQAENTVYISDLTEKIQQYRKHIQDIRLGRQTLSLYRQKQTTNPRFLNTVG